ncbi:MAG: hypothetical protein INR66_12145 [Gordonia polyisoprenivorans]|nr:hypothetical protein [Gordonia polyisoprenivorans]
MKVRAAADLATGSGRAQFEHELTNLGVGFRLNQSPTTGRVNGYSFTDPGHTDQAGQPVWFTASSIDRGLSWSRLAPRLEGPPPDLPVSAGSESKKRFETRAAYTARTQDESRKVHRARRVTALSNEHNAHQHFWRTTPEIDPAKIAADAQRAHLAEALEAARRAAAASRTDFPQSMTAVKKSTRDIAAARPTRAPDRSRDRGRGR